MILKEGAKPILLSPRFRLGLINQNARGAGEVFLIPSFQSQIRPDSGHPDTECIVIGQLTQSQVPNFVWSCCSAEMPASSNTSRR